MWPQTIFSWPATDRSWLERSWRGGESCEVLRQDSFTSSEIERENFTSAYRMISKTESINTMRVSPNGLEARGPGHLIRQSEEMCLSDARKLERLFKRQKGGDGFYKMIGLPRWAHNPAAAGSLDQIQPPQPIFLAARGPVRKVQRRSIERIAIQSSSVVERSAVNRLVVGSNPTSGATSMFWGYVLENAKGQFYIGDRTPQLREPAIRQLPDYEPLRCRPVIE
jgi:hypothetical protein